MDGFGSNYSQVPDLPGGIRVCGRELIQLMGYF